MTRDLNDVLVFQKVVEEHSFTAAAKALSLPTSTVSRRVSRLEEELGVRLLQRTTRKLSLTEAGELYYERSSRAFAELDDAENVLAQSRAEPRGRVRVLAPVEQSITGTLVARFLGRYPQVRVDLHLSSGDPNIIHEGFDAAVHIGTVTNQSLVAHKLADSPFCVVASPAYIAEHGEPATAAALSEHSCLILGDSSSKATWTLRGPAGVERVHVRGRLAVNHLQALRTAAKAGLGIAVLPEIVVGADMRSGELAPLLPEVAPAPVEIFITYPSGRFLAPAVRVFVQFFRESFREAASLSGLAMDRTAEPGASS